MICWLPRCGAGASSQELAGECYWLKTHLTFTYMKKYTFASALATVAVCLLGFATTAQAQATDPGSGGPTPTNTPATEVPIDGGASLLLAGGVALGLKKLRDRRKAR